MDWDGTTSLVRAGWAEIMATLYVEQISPRPDDDPAALHRRAWDEVMRLNGKPSIHQAQRLVELVAEHGGPARDAAFFHNEFQKRLGDSRTQRLSPLRAQSDPTDALLVPGVRKFFETLRTHGLRLTLATGTALSQALEEAKLLGVAHFFEGRIYGPTDAKDTAFSKGAVIQALLQEQEIEGAELLAFGDGPVEIAETVAVGGFAVAVACDENHPGRLDEWKRDLLLAAGAQAVIADYTEAPELLAKLGV